MLSTNRLDEEKIGKLQLNFITDLSENYKTSENNLARKLINKWTARGGVDIIAGVILVYCLATLVLGPVYSAGKDFGRYVYNAMFR